MLGVSHNTLTRARRLADRIHQEAAASRAEHKMRLVAIIPIPVLIVAIFLVIGD